MILQFDHYALDTEKRTLTRQGAPVTLTPKVFQTLLVLVQNHDRVMSKEELFGSIWPQQFVEESNLTQNISVLRKALDETAYGKKYIVTFHGHGYRFLGEVSRVEHKIPTEILSTRLEALSAETPPLVAELTKEAVPFRSNWQWQLVILFAAGVLAVIFGIFSGKNAMRASLVRAAVKPTEVATLTRLEGTQYEPAWSADSQELAFANLTANGASSSIYVQRTGDLQARQMVAGEGEYNSPTWSPDGHSLAYIHTQNNVAEICIFDLDKGTFRELTKLFPHRYGLDYRHLAWSPDGSFLATDDKANEADPLSIYLVHVSNGEKLRLTYPNMDIIGDVAPRFSPDGSHVAFVRIKYQLQEDIFELPLAGGEGQRLTEHSTQLGDVDWETNQSLIFSGRLDDEFRFWRLNLNNLKAHPTLASQTGADMPMQFSISRTSGRIAYSAYRSDPNIWSLDLEKHALTADDWKPVIRTPGQDIAPLFSPDGTKIAFRSDVGGKFQIWVSNIDGSQAFPVDTKSLIPAVNSWEPDGKNLLFKEMSDQGIFSVSLQPKNPITHITDLHLSHPVSSIDGKSIFAISNHFVYRLFRTSGTVEKVTDQGGFPLVQSNDGRYLYFAQGRMEQTISQLDLLTKQQRVIVSSLIPGYSESWALGSKGILFLKEDHDKPVISFHDLATQKEKTITEYRGMIPAVGLSGFSLSPDGHHLLVVRADPVSSNIQCVTLEASAKH